MNKAHIEEVHGSLKIIAALQAADMGWTAFALVMFVLAGCDWLTAIRFAKEGEKE